MQLDPAGAAAHDFTLSVQGEWTLNSALQHVLSVDFNVDLQSAKLGQAVETLDETFDAGAVFSETTAACQVVPGFEISDRVVLANFSYAKLPMAKDLEASLKRLVGIDLVAAIAGDQEAKDSLREALLAEQSMLLGETAPEDEFVVLDADASQSAAINAVARGANTVVQGPPGTGKSQTIANLIATLVARGSKVLFVAEKRAAIDAVLRRLEAVGLGNLVFDLHEGTANRKRIAQGLGEALGRAASTPLPDVSEQQRRLVERREALNRHVEALHQPREPWGLSAYEARSDMLATPSALRAPRRIRGDALRAVGAEEMRACAEALRDYVSRGGPAAAAADGPWSWAARFATLTTPQQAEETLALLENLANDELPALQQAIEAVASLAGTPGSGRICDWAPLPAIVEQAEVVREHFSEEIWHADIATMLEQLRRGSRSGVGALATRVTSGQFRAARKRATDLSRTAPSKLNELVRWLEEAQHCLEAWQVRTGCDLPPKQSEEMLRLAQALRPVLARFDVLQKLTGSDGPQLPCYEALAYARNLLVARDTIMRLPELTRWRSVLTESPLHGVLDDCETLGLTSGSQAVSLLHYVWLASIVDAATMADPALAAFDGRAQDELVTEFRELDKRQISLAAARVQRLCAERLMADRDRYPDESELVVKESLRKRGHLPMRELMPRAANVLMALKPCWAMSPLVVSQLLPNEAIFDVVIFDEASQVPPWDAIPSISRGRTVVVAGDRKQLPPTTFFMSAEDGAAEEEIESDLRLATTDLESVLDLMTAILPAPQGTRTLSWHYRSKDERLIAFSNATFYDNSLTTFPGVDASSCVRLVRVEAQATPGQQESGSSEVARVVELVLEHARLRPAESLGVIAMGIKHADRISEALRQVGGPELSALRDLHPDEPFFVKNLERVQGDERDAIILTVGYGKTVDGRMQYRFGPLNNEWGERRLNVAVTRAKRRLTVVSSFAPAEMDPERLHSEGARLLKAYLEYAESGGTSLAPSARGDVALNPFEIDIGDRLEQAGLALVPQYGVSGYYIDFAVRHPHEPGRMVLAIECDGVRYHSSPSARERDRLRQEHLERLGWRFVRIWSSEWVRDPEAQVARVLEAYGRALQDDESCDPVEAPAPDPAECDLADADPSRVARSGSRPRVPRGLPISDYSQRDLAQLLDWIQSDTLLRTRDEMVACLMQELGFKRRGKHVVTACERAIDRYLAENEPQRLQASRASGSDAWGRLGVKVNWDTTKGWRYKCAKAEVGPVSWADLWRAARRGEVQPETPVFHEAFGRWRSASEFSELFPGRQAP